MHPDRRLPLATGVVDRPGGGQPLLSGSQRRHEAELLRAGVLKPAEAARHPWRHVITNAIGGTETGGRPELQRVSVRSGDLILLCSDGLTDMVSDDEILAEVRAEASPERLSQRLVSRANERGGRDNITVVVARLINPGAD
jgi:serine/threonine protein phosphatase PrpC